MRKFNQSIITASIAALIVLSCSSKKDEATHTNEQTENNQEWPEMDAFHMTMAEVYHPYKDSANLQPIKTQATKLATDAEIWANTPLPEPVNNEEVKKKLEELKNGTASLATLVTTGTDEDIAKSLVEIHDTFHGITDAWYGNKNHKHDHEHHH